MAIISTVASVGGSMMNSSQAASNQAAMIRARNQATQAELARQHAFQDQATQAFQSTMQKFQPDAQNANLQTSQASNASTLQANAPTAEMVGSITSNDAPKVVTTDASGKIAGRLGKIAASNTALGDLTGYDSVNQANGLAIGDSSRKIGTISDFARNSANLAGLDREVAANNAYRPPSPLGDILGQLGGMGLSYVGGGGKGLSSIFGGGASPMGFGAYSPGSIASSGGTGLIY